MAWLLFCERFLGTDIFGRVGQVPVSEAISAIPCRIQTAAKNRLIVLDRHEQRVAAQRIRPIGVHAANFLCMVPLSVAQRCQFGAYTPAVNAREIHWRLVWTETQMDLAFAVADQTRRVLVT
jgi:hypothetical protein